MSQRIENVETSINKVKSAFAEAKEAQDQFTTENKNLNDLKQEYIELSTKVNQTKEDQTRLKEILSELESMCPGVAGALQGITDKYSYQQDVIDGVNKKIEENIRLMKAQQQQAVNEAVPDMKEAAEKYQEAADQQDKIDKAMESMARQWNKRGNGYLAFQNTQGGYFFQHNGTSVTPEEVANYFAGLQPGSTARIDILSALNYDAGIRGYAQEGFDNLSGNYIRKYLGGMISDYQGNKDMLEYTGQNLRNTAREGLLAWMDTTDLP